MSKSFHQQKGESNQAFAAFRTYLEMGDKRSARAVGKKLGKSTGLIERWCARRKWTKRVADFNQSVLAESERKAVQRRLPALMGITEIIGRTSFFARATLDDVLDEEGRFDMKKARETGGIHVLKRIKTRTWTRQKNGYEETIVTHEVELRDKNASLELMGRHFRLWTDEEDPDTEAKRLLEMEAPSACNRY